MSFVKLSLCLTNKALRHEDVWGSGYVGGPSASHTGRFTPGERAFVTHWIGGWMGPRTGLDAVEKILDPTGTRTLTPRSSSPLPVAIPTELSWLLVSSSPQQNKLK
jgi:hypothetical protein